MVNVFVAVTGQEDNIGDSILRRGLLDAIRISGATLHVNVGKNSAGYCSTLAFSDADVIYHSTRDWYTEFDRSIRSRERTHFVFNAGEALIEKDHSYIGLRLLLRLLLVRARNGRVLHTGIGIRQSAAKASFIVRCALALCSIVSWRDAVSAERVGVGDVNPDWAFAVSTSDEGAASITETRDLLLISMRGDREYPTPEWFDAVRELVRRTGLTPHVAAQVRRDNDRTEAIAVELGTAVWSTWTKDDHAEREFEMRGLFARSRAVVSDRLHALIIGATEGARPLGITVGSAEKVKRTLDVVGLGGACFSIADVSSGEAVDRVMTALADDDVRILCGEARRSLDGLSVRMARALS